MQQAGRHSAVSWRAAACCPACAVTSPPTHPDPPFLPIAVFDVDNDKPRAAWEMEGSTDWKADGVDATNGFSFEVRGWGCWGLGLLQVLATAAFAGWAGSAGWFQRCQRCRVPLTQQPHLPPHRAIVPLVIAPPVPTLHRLCRAPTPTPWTTA